jgi:hypothetical protein
MTQLANQNPQRKFRKKPVIIEAMWLTASNYAEAKAWVEDSGGLASLGSGEISVCIRTLEGEVRADVGDWIIKGVKGEFYPCKPDIFKATYEPVE